MRTGRICFERLLLCVCFWILVTPLLWSVLDSDCPSPLVRKKRHLDQLYQPLKTLGSAQSNWTIWNLICIFLWFRFSFWTSSDFLSFYLPPVSKYSGLSLECCVNGMRMMDDYTCSYRSKFIVDGEACVRAFLHCCNEMNNLRKTLKVEGELTLARSKIFPTSFLTPHLWPKSGMDWHVTAMVFKCLLCLGLAGEMEAFVNSDSIVTRTLFPESWLWEETTLPKCPSMNPNWSVRFLWSYGF